jgi:hypothetical protein
MLEIKVKARRPYLVRRVMIRTLLRYVEVYDRGLKVIFFNSQHNVIRIQVAMHDTFTVHVI